MTKTVDNKNSKKGPEVVLYSPVNRASRCNRSEKEVWADFVKGSDEAFCEIYRTYFEVLVRLGRQFLLSKEVIQDAVQDFFIELREKRANLSRIERIRPYLIKSFRRRLIVLKKSRERNGSGLEDFYAIQLLTTPSREKVISEKEMELERFGRLDNAIKKLSVNQREAIYYLYFEGMSYKDIRQVMGLKYVRSARNLVYKALDKLRKAYLQ